MVQAEDSGLPEQADPEFHLFMDYWKSLTAGGTIIPSRRAFDLLAVPSLTARYAIIEWFDDGKSRKLRYRYFGSTHQVYIGRDLTGRLIDDVWDALTTEIAYDLYGGLSKTGKPHFWKRAVEFAGSTSMGFNRLICPLEETDGQPRMFIGLWKFLDVSPENIDSEPHVLSVRNPE
ncbi:MAG: hypothetical protein RJQ21_10805 [Rhodospirillales bacterium]